MGRLVYARVVSSEKKLSQNLLKEESGVISVWLTLLALCVISFIMIVLEVVKLETAQEKLTRFSNLATYSCMADYDIDVYENYGIYMMEESALINQDSSLCESLLKYEAMVRSFVNNNKTSYVNSFEVKNADIDDIEHIEAKDILDQLCNRENGEYANIETYIIQNFSSYKNPYIKGYMKRKHLYEVEYLIGGKKTDNENIKIIREKLADYMSSKELNELSCTDSEYEAYMIQLLEEIDDMVLAERVLNLVIHNINDTFEKNMCKESLIVGLKTKTEFYMTSSLKDILTACNLSEDLPSLYSLKIKSKYFY